MSRTVPPRNRPPDGRGGHNPTSQETETSREIIVTNLPRSCSKDLLVNYFESRRNCGYDMVVEGVTFDGEQTQAIVEFASHNGVDVVLSRKPCKLEGKVLHIEEYKKPMAPPAPPESHGDYSDFYEVAVKSGPGDTATIEVGNYNNSTSDDALKYYFENEKRSGGGDTTDVTFDRKQNVAQVTFKDKRAVARVMKKSHVIDGQTLTVKPYITSDTDVLLKDLPDTLTEENLNNFIKAKFKNTVAHITFNEERSKAIVSLDRPADFRLITDACRKYGIGGSHIVAARVPISNCVIVTNLPELQTKDSYQFYFKLPKHGGGDVDKVDLHASDGYCLVYFHDIKVVELVCKKNHTIANTHMHVKPYQTCLGIPATRRNAKFTFPSTESLSHIDGYKKKFLERNDTQHKALDEKLASCHGEVVWDANPVEIECTLTTRDKGYRELSKAWKSKVTETFQQFINILDVKKHTVSGTTWEHVMDGMGSVDISHPDGMAVFAEKDKFTIILVGLIGIVQKNWPLIESVIKKAEREVKELKTVVDEQKELKVWQVRYLHAVCFIEEIKIEFAKVKVTLDQNKCRISFKGPKSDVSSAQVQMYQKLQEVKSSKVNIGKEYVQLLQNKTTEARISDQMREHNLGQVWEVKFGDLIVYGDTDADLSKMKNVVMKVLIKTTIGLDSQTKEILDSSKWNKKKFELEKKHSECVVFNLNTNENCLEIFTIDTVKNEIVSELQGFLSKNAVYTEQMTVDPCVAVFITRIFGDEIKRIAQNSSKKGEKVDITFTQGGTVYVEGSRDGLTAGKGIVSQLEGKVKKRQHTITQPNIQAYLATEQWKECKQNLERTIPCVMDSGLGRSIGGQGQRRNITGPSSTAEGHERHHRGSENTRDHFSASDTAMDSCTMTIYAESMGHINSAVKRMEKIIDEQWHTKTVKDDAIFKLHQRQMESIKKEAMNNHCQVTIDQDTSFITIRGLVSNVMAVNDKVHAILRNQDKSMYERNIAQQMKNIVRWYYLKGQKQLPFPDRDNLTVETAYKEKRKSVRIKDKSGGEYEIDFTNMVEVELANTANKFPVIRIDLIKDTQTIEGENQKLREMQICKICMDKPVYVTFLPCGHFVCCQDCAPTLKICPICRMEINGRVNTFMS